MSDIRVSVVIPTFNRARDLERALGSLRQQTIANWEAILVDGQSTDDTADVVARLNDPRISLYQSPQRDIIAAKRNLGIALARGTYIALLDSDDWWRRNKLEISLAHLDGGADVVYHDLYRVTAADQRRFWQRVRSRELSVPVFTDLLHNGNALPNSSVVIRRELLKRVGGLSEDPDLVGAEDFDLWLRVARQSARFNRIGQPLGYYWAAGGNTSNPARVIRTLDVIERRYADDLSPPGDRPWWIDNSRGRAYFHMADYDRASENLRRVTFRTAPIPAAVKSRYLRALADRRRPRSLRHT